MEPDEIRPTAAEWLAAFAHALGVGAPSLEDADAVLGLAGLAAHASERAAAPVACWIAARAGVTAAEAARVAATLHVEGTGRRPGGPGPARVEPAAGS
jgi:hypothetical protein